MKPIDPLKYDSIADFIRVSVSGGKKRQKSTRGGLSSMGLRRATIREPSVKHRRVIIKSIIIKNNGAGWNERRAKHFEYIQRDGTSIDGKRSTIYDLDGDAVDVAKFLYCSRNDPHEFRFIVSAEDAGKLELKFFIEELMGRMAKELGTKLQWMAADHYNTDNPHTHIVMRGVDQLGNPLILSRDFISNGIRNLAKEIVTRELGERSEIEMAKEISESIRKRRATHLDFSFERMAGDSRIVSLSATMKLSGIAVESRAQARRLDFLSEIGLAIPIDGVSWQLEADLIPKLKEMGFQGDIIKMLHKESKTLGNIECVVVKAEIHGKLGIQGTVSARGISNELTDREYIVLNGRDGKAYYLDLELRAEKSRSNIGDEVKIGLQEPQKFFKKSDENIIEFASKSANIYDPSAHLEWIRKNVWFPVNDPLRTPEKYVDKHVSRLKFLTSLGVVEPLVDGRWKVDPQMSSKMELFEKAEQAKPKIAIVNLTVEASKVSSNTTSNEVIHFDKSDVPSIQGRITERGVLNNQSDKPYIVVKAKDGRDYSVSLSLSQSNRLRMHDLVRIEAKTGNQPDIRVLERGAKVATTVDTRLLGETIEQSIPSKGIKK